MKYCSHCGAEIDDEAVICVHCGSMVEENNVEDAPTTERNKKLGGVAKAFGIVSLVLAIVSGLLLLLLAGYVDDVEIKSQCISNGISSLISLCWIIPMFVALNRKLNNNQPIGTAFKVWFLILVSPISGICLLCRKEQQNNQ